LHRATTRANISFLQASKANMSTPATIPTKPELFDRYVRKFRSICEMHGIQFGSHQNLPEFLHRLADDRYFAMDFWAFTGKLSRREDGELSDEQMLALIVEGIAGDELADADDELKGVIAELAALLAGVDVQSPSQNHVEPAPFPHTAPDSNAGEETTGDGSEMPWRASSLHAAFLSEAIDREAKTAPLASSSLSPQLEETLRLLQASSNELKQHLDEIDKKMSRLEPRLEERTSKGAPKEQTRGPVEQATMPPVETFTREPGGKARLVLQPDVSPRPEFVSTEPSRPELFSMFATKKDKTRDDRDDNDEWDPVPLELYAEQRGPNGIALFVILMLLVVGGTFYLQRYGAPLHMRYAPLIQRVQEAISDRLGLSSTNESTASNASVASNASPVSGMVSATNSAGTTGSGATGKIASKPATPRISSPQEAPAAASNDTSGDKAPATPLDQSQAAEATTDLRTTRRPTISRSQSQAEEAALADRRMAATDTSGAEDAAPVNVAPAVMEANLVLSRVPAYPEVAKADRVQGPVVVKAIISKAGTVQDVHVIQGDPLLRSAAAEAIYKWRYRPYLLNGQPVQVATTITVDFKLSPYR
jgi:TonB family protein